MKEYHNYILTVDADRCSQRNKSGERYRVGARTEKEAITLLKSKIKNGHIQVAFLCDHRFEQKHERVDYLEIAKEIPLENGNYKKAML